MRLIIININNYKLGASKNFISGILLTPKKYDFYALSDQDDIWFSNKLISAVKILDQTQCSGYSSSIYILYNNLVRYENKRNKNKKYDYFFESAGPGCTYLFNNNVYELLTYHFGINQDWPRLFYHDWIIYSLCRKNHINWFIDEKSYFYYRQHESNLVGANYNFRSYLSRIRMVLDGSFFRISFSQLRYIKMKVDFNLFFILGNIFQFRRKNFHSFIISLLLIFYKFVSKIK